MGPCWLSIKNPNSMGVINVRLCSRFFFYKVQGNANLFQGSWCKLELQVDKPFNIEVFGDHEGDAPPLTLMSISLRTQLNARDNKQVIIVASARIYENVSLEDPTPPEKLPSYTFTVIRPAQDMFPAGFEQIVEKHNDNIKLERTETGLLSYLLGK